MKQTTKIVYLISIFFLLAFVAKTEGREELSQPQPRNTSSSSSTFSQDEDLAAGILDVGELKNTVFNNGLIATWGWTGFIIPELPAGYYKGYGYMADLNIWIGVPEGPWNPPGISGPTVSEAQLGSPHTWDWGPLPGSLGRLHSGDVTVGQLYPDAPLSSLPVMATSTVPESWPKDEGGSGFWPGPWAVDPNTGQEMEGVFVSDKDIFFIITDGPYADRDDRPDQGYPLDIQLDISGYSYDSPYDDFLCFPMKLINLSQRDYYGMYVGFYYDADVPEYDESGIINDRFDWMAFNREQNMAYIFDYRWGTGDWPTTDPEAYQVYCGVKLLETPKDQEGNQLGLTDWHWFEWENRPGVVIPERQELIQYKVLSGDTTDLEWEEWAAYFHEDLEGNLNPHLDSWEAIQRDYPDGLDCVCLMSSGPFNLAAGETTTFAFALIMGDDEEDLFANSSLAQALYENNFIPLHPRVEEVSAVVEQISVDTSKVTVTLRAYDPDGIALVMATFESPDEMVIDSLMLYDDGQHSDGGAADSLYGNSWYVTTAMREYFVDIAVTDLVSVTINLNNAATFWAGSGVLPPLDLVAEPQENRIYLMWTPNPPGATAGYKIYYDSDSSGSPYEGTDANQGVSPIVIDSAADSGLVLSGLANGLTYYLAITAYDTIGIESGYADEVTAVPGVYFPPEVRFRGLSMDQEAELDWRGYLAPADLKMFNLYRDFAIIDSTTETKYLDTGLSNGTVYRYYVTAVDSVGNETSYTYALDIQPAPMSSGFPLNMDALTDAYSPTVVDIDGGGDQEMIVVTAAQGDY
ncbi:MAG: fibronectin type III domain-containing protein, partial [bacterium]